MPVQCAKTCPQLSHNSRTIATCKDTKNLVNIIILPKKSNNVMINKKQIEDPEIILEKGSKQNTFEPLYKK